MLFNFIFLEGELAIPFNEIWELKIQISSNQLKKYLLHLLGYQVHY
jgi:hypothetical protein